jgi:endonuclease YncB( thermonuclease family)
MGLTPMGYRLFLNKAYMLKFRNFAAHVLCAAALFLSINAEVQAQSFSFKGTVIRVLDGDTLTVRMDKIGNTVEVSLAEIDAPEMSQGADRPMQPYGDLALANLRKYVGINEEVTAECSNKNVHGRSVCRLVTSKGIDLSLAMVSTGYAQVYRRYARDGALLIAEQKAKAEAIGIWAGMYPLAPETWRRVCWDAALRPDNAWCEDGRKPTPVAVMPKSENSEPPASSWASIWAAYSELSHWFDTRTNSFLNRIRP